ncbi:MAG: GNAT family N-acetyltransferase [Janthinobacterium lividum]
MFASAPQLEVLDLRHFSAAALRPLLLEEAAVWERRLLWDYSRSINLLLEYVDSRSLTGYVALRAGRVAGYVFGVCEATKAVLGDVYAFGEGEQKANPVCDLLLDHLLETLESTPGIDRIESQLLLFPDGALRTPFASRNMRAFPRHFMTQTLSPVTSSGKTIASHPVPERWQPECYLPAAALIHQAYAGHTDSEINDQYRTLIGAKRFLHNIVHFPGCGVFDPADSWVLRDRRSGELEGLILCSRVRGDAAHITQLCVRSDLRGHGLGKRLLAHCLAELARNDIRTVSLTVTGSNLGARQLYEQQGFTTLHRFEAWVWNKHP